MFSADFISGSRNFTQHLTSGVFILIHSADACILVMACVDCARACSEKPFRASLRWLTTVWMNYNSPTSNSFEKCSKMFSFFIYYLLKVPL